MVLIPERSSGSTSTTVFTPRSVHHLLASGGSDCRLTPSSRLAHLVRVCTRQRSICSCKKRSTVSLLVRRSRLQSLVLPSGTSRRVALSDPRRRVTNVRLPPITLPCFQHAAYFLSLGLPEEKAAELHKKYYREYGLAIRGLVKHHEISASSPPAHPRHVPPEAHAQPN